MVMNENKAETRKDIEGEVRKERHTKHTELHNLTDSEIDFLTGWSQREMYHSLDMLQRNLGKEEEESWTRMCVMYRKLFVELQAHAAGQKIERDIQQGAREANQKEYGF